MRGVIGSDGYRDFHYFFVSSHQKLNYMTMNRLLFLLTSLVAIFVVGCTHDTPEPTPTPEPEPKAEFEVVITDVTRSTVTFNVTPADLDAEYLCVIYDKESVEEESEKESEKE